MLIFSVPGIHNVHNACAALCIAAYYGVDINKAAQKLSEYTPMAMRGQTYDINGAVIIDDTYNSSPDSVKSALNVLLGQKNAGENELQFWQTYLSLVRFRASFIQSLENTFQGRMQTENAQMC